MNVVKQRGASPCSASEPLLHLDNDSIIRASHSPRNSRQASFVQFIGDTSCFCCFITLPFLSFVPPVVSSLHAYAIAFALLAAMELATTLPRTLPRRAMTMATSTRHLGGITLPMAVWSRRQFSSAQGLSLPPPLTSLGGSSSASGGPSYFQRTQRLPSNTVVKFVPQQQAWVVERFGKFSRILDPGLAILIPLVDVRSPICN